MAGRSYGERGSSLRADARRNRETLLEAARLLFARHGLDAPMEDVARAAGVGVATLYRHFATKEALIDAVLERRLGVATEELAAARREEPDPWAALARFVRRAAHMSKDDRALALCLGGQIHLGEHARSLQRTLIDACDELVGEAKAAGVLRPDVGPGDLAMLLGVGHSSWIDLEESEALLDRYLAIVLDGLRAPGLEPMPASPLTRDDVDLMLGL
jgi:AcrR family transcriptional regulator